MTSLNDTYYDVKDPTDQPTEAYILIHADTFYHVHHWRMKGSDIVEFYDWEGETVIAIPVREKWKVIRGDYLTETTIGEKMTKAEKDLEELQARGAVILTGLTGKGMEKSMTGTVDQGILKKTRTN